MDKIEFENGSSIETIKSNNNVRSKRGQDLLNKLLKDLCNKTDEELMQELDKDGIEYTYLGMDDYAKHTSKLEDMQINIGTILLVNKDGINEEYQVLDNSEINAEYPFALLDIKKHRIVQTSVSLDYMNFGHYIYIDKEYEIINIR
jgi:hypothetical protein